jgi:transforming growth factor-beta-induced protein
LAPQKFLMHRLFLLASGLALLFTFGCNLNDDDGPVGPQFSSMAQIIRSSDDFTVLERILERTNFTETFEIGGFTAFAPTDAAFAAINFDPEALDTQQLENILRYHILPSAFRPANSIPNGQLYLETANGDSPNGAAVALFLEKDGDQIILNNRAEVIEADRAANNGIIHVIDFPLSPPTVADLIDNNPLVSELASAIDAAAGISDTLRVRDVLSAPGPLTVFTPIDEAFADAPDLTPSGLRDVLLYHVVSGRNVQLDLFPGSMTSVQGDPLVFNGTSIITTSDQTLNVVFENVQGTNGILHLIDAVMVPEGI